MKQALGRKRKVERELKNNFRIITPQDESEKEMRKWIYAGGVGMSPFSLSVGTLDPFGTLIVDSSRLQTLLGDCKLLPATEPHVPSAYHRLSQITHGSLSNQSSTSSRLIPFALFSELD